MQGRLLRDPLFVFALAGILLFLAYGMVSDSGREPIRLSAETHARLIEDAERLSGRKASAEEIERIERHYIAEELLLREALDAGMHLEDRVVRARLIEEMRYRITGLLPDPSDEELVNHYAENQQRYLAEPSISFEQRLFTGLRPEQATDLMAGLDEEALPATGADWQGQDFPDFGESMIRGLYGQAFLEALRGAPLGQWSGPLESPAGMHFVRPRARTAATLLPFDAVRQQVENDYLVMLIQQAVDARVEQLRSRHEVVIER